VKIFLLAGFIAALIGAQSVPPRKDIPAIAKSANGAIVSIVLSDKDGHAVAQGSGFVVSTDGIIVTNYHVIENGSSAIVKLPDGAFFAVDGVLAFDKARDVAVIKAHGKNFRTLALGNSDKLQVGEEVVAIGNPLSLESTVSNGIVSGIRNIKDEGGKFLQITAPISPGSSGGPLFNMTGEVVGITTLYLEGGESLNFAIPINDAKLLLLPKFSKLQDLPNEPIPVQTTNVSSSSRDYFAQLVSAGGLGKHYLNAHVCFEDKEHGNFFIIEGMAYDSYYASAEGRSEHIPLNTPENRAAYMKTVREKEVVQRAAPYIYVLQRRAS
jgi:S1-C subfamily serine protease